MRNRQRRMISERDRVKEEIATDGGDTGQEHGETEEGEKEHGERQGGKRQIGERDRRER